MSRFTFVETKIENLFVIEPKQIKDERGYFERYFCKENFKEIGLSKEIVQINHSLTKLKGSIRGMHFQTKPFSEIKIIRCISGSIQDVAVDLRKDSKTFLKHFTITLSKSNNKYLYIPEGFAHGFQALSNNAEILYLTTAPFQSSADSTINPLDKVLNIKWNLDITNISPKDKNAPFIDGNFKGI
ncbi:dTDP-4-dehydrorhamnose 3,5-epimerase [Helicobacter sp. MIT 99-5507]|uniref:dTDP-4-dehydrorhamnose 3,5-epimerase n=1 Tax=Helicobacter sp. MIT 99-5507 TaxID=152489 RepID=UPI000E1F4A32|nr:dTDP-4-dehydrorhamnose 3,5-epimerase [Helicobacter sp. MIT 99-5507]RDU58324.1 dTDP-4-dehydrorhamnose 3,5-epimerase [Helicobacter sp. MIT 99-5507]